MIRYHIIPSYGCFHKFMIPRLAVLNSNVSGAASTTGPDLDTSYGVYIGCQSSCTHSGTITVGIYRGNLVMGECRSIHTSTNGTTRTASSSRDALSTATTSNLHNAIVIDCTRQQPRYSHSPQHRNRYRYCTHFIVQTVYRRDSTSALSITTVQ